MQTNETYGITVEDLEKAASVRLFEKAAAAEGINLAELSESQVEDLYAAYQQHSSEDNTPMNDELIDLFEKQAAYEGVDLDGLSDEELAYVFNNFVENISDDYDDDYEEEEAYEKLAEAEILGRHMARAYMSELEDYGYSFDKEAAIDRTQGQYQQLARQARANVAKTYKTQKALQTAKNSGAFKRKVAAEFKKLQADFDEQRRSFKAKSEEQRLKNRAGGEARFKASTKGQEIEEDKAIREIEKKREKRRKAEEAQKKLVAEQDMTPEQKRARAAKASRDEATAKLKDSAKRVGTRIDTFAQTVGQALGGKKDVYSGAKRTESGKRIKGSGKLMQSNALSRRLRGYGALGAGTAALGAGAYGLSQMGKEASFELFEEEAMDRAEQFIAFGKEAGLDDSAIDMRALELLAEAGYDIEPIVYPDSDDDYYDDDYLY